MLHSKQKVAWKGSPECDLSQIRPTEGDATIQSSSIMSRPTTPTPTPPPPPCGYNSSDSYPSEQIILRIYCIFPAILIGLVGNGINITVFAHRSMRRSTTNWFLFTLALSDTVLLLSSFNMLVLPVLTERADTYEGHSAAQYLMRVFFPLSQLAQTVSVYTIVTVSGHRFLGICHPFLAQRYCTPHTTKLTIASTVMFAVVFTLPRWMSITLAECYSFGFNRTGYLITIHPLYRHAMYSLVYSVLAYILVMFLLPFCTLCIFDVHLIRAVRKSNDLQRRTANTFRRRTRELLIERSRAATFDNGGGEEGGGSLRETAENLNKTKRRIPSSQSLLAPGENLKFAGDSLLVLPPSSLRSSPNSSFRRQHQYSSTKNEKFVKSRSSLRQTFLTKHSRSWRWRRRGFPKIDTHCWSPPHASQTNSTKSHQNGGASSTTTGNNNSKDTNITLMLISIVTLFLLCNTLPFLNNILELLVVTTKADESGKALLFRVLVELGNLLVTLNSSSYILIYYAFNSKYRTVFRFYCGWLGGRGLQNEASNRNAAMTWATTAHHQQYVGSTIKRNRTHHPQQQQQQQQQQSDPSPQQQQQQQQGTQGDHGTTVTEAAAVHVGNPALVKSGKKPHKPKMMTKQLTPSPLIPNENQNENFK